MNKKLHEWDQGFLCLDHNKKFCAECQPKVIRFATNFQWVGKPWQGEDGVYYRGKRISPGWYWHNGEATLPEILNMLAIDGMPIAPELSDPLDVNPFHEKYLNRKEMYFKSAQIALVDIDSGMTIEQLKANKWYKRFSCGFYTTPSHTPDKPRFRILFLLESPIERAEDMRLLYRGLITLFGGDGACKDGCRLFYGTPNATECEYREGIVMSDEVVLSIIDRERKEIQQELMKSQLTDKDYTPPTNKVKSKVIELLKTAYSGEYNTWFVLACAMKRSGFSQEDFIEATCGGLMRSKTPSRCAQVWKAICDDHPSKASMGTIIWYLKSRLGSDVVKELK